MLADILGMVITWGIIGGLVFTALGTGWGTRKPMACIRCGSTDYPTVSTRGSILIEIVLWLCLIVPGVVYSLWRLTSGKVRVCRSCGSEDIVPLDSPRGRQITGG